MAPKHPVIITGSTSTTSQKPSGPWRYGIAAAAVVHDDLGGDPASSAVVQATIHSPNAAKLPIRSIAWDVVPCPIDPHIRDYAMHRFIAAHSFFDHSLNEAIGILGGIDDRHRRQSYTVKVRIHRLRQLMLDRGLITESDQTFTHLLDEYLRVEAQLKRVHKCFYVGQDGVLVLLC